jgi:hypothetical protein
MDDEPDRFWGKYGLRLFLTLFVLAGAYLVQVFEQSGPYPLKFGEHLAMATCVAGIIGLIIEYTLQREIAKNAFRAAIGYLLPEELRGELRWIYDQSFLCENHEQVAHIEPIGNSKVRVRNEVKRDVKNITAGTKSFNPGLGINEWLHDEGESRILNYSYQLQGKDSVNFSPIDNYLVRKGNGLALDSKSEVSVKSGEKFTICFEIEEIKSESDWTFLHFGTPTAQTTLFVYAPDELQTEVDFSHRQNDPKIKEVNPHTWHLDAVLLPLQSIRITWYPKDKAKAWRERSNH